MSSERENNSDLINIENNLENLSQGDVFSNIKYYSNHTETKYNVEMFEYIFPRIIVLSQSCDVEWMSKLIKGEGSNSVNKILLSVLVAPIYKLPELKNGNIYNELLKEHGLEKDITNKLAFNSDKYNNAIKQNEHIRYQLIKIDGDDYIIDFKHYFTMSAFELFEKRTKRIGRINFNKTLKITNQFAAFLSRIGIE